MADRRPPLSTHLRATAPRSDFAPRSYQERTVDFPGGREESEFLAQGASSVESKVRGNQVARSDSHPQPDPSAMKLAFGAPVGQPSVAGLRRVPTNQGR